MDGLSSFVSINGKKSLCLFLDTVLSAEAFDAACRIDELLFAGKERVARRANFNIDVLYGRTSLYHVAAGASDLGELVFRVDTLFHISILHMEY